MRLLTMTMEEIHKEVKKLEDESKALKKELYKLAWFMRGALTFEQAYLLDVADRGIISEIVQENLETTKESQLPFF
jgi:hypothetical protein